MNCSIKEFFADTSMRDIAEVMNVKAASLYAHIKSKEEIMDGLVMMFLTDL